METLSSVQFKYLVALIGWECAEGRGEEERRGGGEGEGGGGGGGGGGVSWAR